MGISNGNSSLNVLRTRAGQLKVLRAGMMIRIFASVPIAGDANTPILNDIANSFSRFAAYQQTAFDKGASRSSSSNDANVMERQVERAITQVLGRAPGRSVNSFMNALNSTFPALIGVGEGPQVAFTPSRSMVSLYQGVSSNGASPLNGYSSGVGMANGYPGTISARQANLYREASIISSDALRVLDSLMPFVPVAEPDQVEALKALIRSEINALVDEFGRVDEPRSERVFAYFSALRLHITGLGERAFLNNPNLAVTVEDETQTAGFELLGTYQRTLSKTWDTFFKVDRKSTISFSLSERVERANILLPVVAQANADFEAAMDSVDFTESERRSMAARFETLKGLGLGSGLGGSRKGSGAALFINSTGNPIDKRLPTITVYDLNEWVDRFATIEGPSNLADSGLYGLDFVTDQADRLFWIIVPVVAHLELDQFGFALGNSSLEQVLSNERVRIALNNLLSQLDVLADLSIAGADENLLPALGA
jgi:hypothetical protein